MTEDLHYRMAQAEFADAFDHGKILCPFCGDHDPLIIPRSCHYTAARDCCPNWQNYLLDKEKRFDRDEIDDTIRKIMRNDGPDGHVDGHEVITDFVCALLRGEGKSWASNYKSKRQKLDEDPEYLELKSKYPEAFE